MTWFEFRAHIVLQVARLLHVRLRDLYDSYPYNPLSKTEVREAYPYPKTYAQIARLRARLNKRTSDD